jgi:hypothetical protein
MNVYAEKKKKKIYIKTWALSVSSNLTYVIFNTFSSEYSTSRRWKTDLVSFLSLPVERKVQELTG